MQGYLALNQQYIVANYLTMVTDQNLRKTLRKYRLSEHSLAIEKGRHRKTWLPVEERLCNHCTTAEPETELHFLTKCQKYKTIRVISPNFETLVQGFKDLSDEDKPPVLLGGGRRELWVGSALHCCLP
jgi:hypothetical protein